MKRPDSGGSSGPGDAPRPNDPGRRVRDEIARAQQHVHESQKVDESESVGGRSLDEILANLNARVETPEYQARLMRMTVEDREKRLVAEQRASHLRRMREKRNAAAQERRRQKSGKQAAVDETPKKPQLTLLPGGKP